MEVNLAPLLNSAVNKLQLIAEKVDALTERVSRIEARLSRVENENISTTTRIYNIDRRVNENDFRIARIGHVMDNEIDKSADIEKEIADRIESINQHTDEALKIVKIKYAQTVSLLRSCADDTLPGRLSSVGLYDQTVIAARRCMAREQLKKDLAHFGAEDDRTRLWLWKFLMKIAEKYGTTTRFTGRVVGTGPRNLFCIAFSDSAAVGVLYDSRTPPTLCFGERRINPSLIDHAALERIDCAPNNIANYEELVKHVINQLERV